MPLLLPHTGRCSRGETSRAQRAEQGRGATAACMQRAALWGLGQRSGGSGSTVFGGARCSSCCSEDAQLQIQSWALPSPPCRPPLCKPSLVFALGGCRRQLQGVLCGLLFPHTKPNHPACWKPARFPASLPEKLGRNRSGRVRLLSHQTHVNC